MPDIILNFPLLNGGEEEGLNDAGIETFEGDVGDYIARECGQNTSDASVDGKVELHFNLLEMPLNDLPCLTALKNVFEQCKEYWSSDQKAVKFFDDGISLLQRKILPVLKVSDYGTTGLTGSDTDRTSKWYGLVRSKGACNKGEGSGGSFGIGKYAPFAASSLRTVYYYTKTDRNVAFQGISRLVTHCNGEDLQTQATGYIGEHVIDGNRQQFLSLRDHGSIPAHFHRSGETLGTDIYVPAYRETTNWKERLTISVLNNFWPAICLEKILFKIDDTIIDHTNIDIFIEQYKADPDFNAYRYFNAYRNGQQYRDKLKYVCDSELRLSIDTQRESNPIAVARKNGMIIETWGHFRSRKPISGIYICHDPEGNEVLRKLEPPRHDKWDQKRDQNGKEVLGTIKEWVRSCIDELLPAEESESFDLDVLSKFIPDDPDDEQGEEAFDGNESPENNKGFESAPTEPKKDITKAVLPPITAEPDDQGEETDLPTNGGEGGSGGSGSGKGGGGGGDGGGKGKGGGSGGTGSSENTTASVTVLNMRCIYDESDNSYNIILRTRKKFDGKISFAAECDDGTAENILISKVILNSQEIPLVGNGQGFQAAIEPDSPETYKVFFKQAEKMSLRIV